MVDTTNPNNRGSQHTTQNNNSVSEKMRQLIQKKSVEDWGAEEIITFGSELGKFLKQQEVSTHQIRRFIDELQRIKYSNSLDLNRVKFMKVKLVYAVGRATGKARQGLNELEQCVSCFLNEPFAESRALVRQGFFEHKEGLHPNLRERKWYPPNHFYGGEVQRVHSTNMALFL